MNTVRFVIGFKVDTGTGRCTFCVLERTAPDGDIFCRNNTDRLPVLGFDFQFFQKKIFAMIFFAASQIDAVTAA